MIKTKFVTETRQVEEIEDILCNKCGGTLRPQHTHDFYGLQEVSFTTGYFSHRELDDGNVYKFSLCETCLVWLFGIFELPPTRTEYFE